MNWFAWYPVKTVSGKWVWFKTVQRTWNFDLNPWCYWEYSGADGGWEYERTY